jgi:hypothetical protein
MFQIFKGISNFQNFYVIIPRFLMQPVNDVPRNPGWETLPWVTASQYAYTFTVYILLNHWNDTSYGKGKRHFERPSEHFEISVIIYLSPQRLIAEPLISHQHCNENRKPPRLLRLQHLPEKTDNLAQAGTELRFVECETEMINAESL